LVATLPAILHALSIHSKKKPLAVLSTFCFPARRAFIPADQPWVWSWCTSDLLGIATYDRCNAQLEILNGFDWALFLHCFFGNYLPNRAPWQTGRIIDHSGASKRF